MILLGVNTREVFVDIVGVEEIRCDDFMSVSL